MRFHKKSVLLYGIVIGLVLGFGLFLINYIKLSNEIKQGTASQSKYIGDIEISSIQAYQSGEKLLLYIDQAAKYSAEKALADVANSWAAVNENTRCGEIDGYAIYQTFNRTSGKITDCFPDSNDIEQNFLNSFNSNFNDYARAYYLASLPLDNYIFSLKPTQKGTDILGIAVQNFNATVQPKEDIDEKLFFKAVQDLADKNSFFWVPGGRITQPISTPITSPGNVLGNMVSIRNGYVGLCENDCMLAMEAAQRLRKAEDIAKADGTSLNVYSSYRTEEKQRQLWEELGRNPRKACGPDASGSFMRCSHNQGIAVDIQLLNTLMNAENKQKLLNIMCRADWVNYADEWWHFEIGTERYNKAKAAGVCSLP